ncbi:acyltransferase [Paraburkholderia jirisanensis]
MPGKKNSKEPDVTRLNSLTALRAIAATTVIFFHLMSPTGTRFGEFGVDIFFVLSGFVIAMVIDGKQISAREFLMGRLTRIVPVYWLMTIALFVAVSVRPDLVNSTTASIPNLLKSLFFIPYRKENGLIHPMLFVGWSLNYELLFYMISGAVLILFRRYRLASISAVLLIVFAIASEMPFDEVWVEFLSLARSLEFALGIAAWCIWKRDYRIPHQLAAVGVPTLYCGMAYVEWIGITDYALLRSGIPCFLLLLCATSLEAWFANVGVMRVMIFLGNASYATYLSHSFVVEAARKLLPVYLHGFEPTSPLGVAVVLVCALLVGALIYCFVDRPTQRLVRNLTLRRAARLRIASNDGPQQA